MKEAVINKSYPPALKQINNNTKIPMDEESENIMTGCIVMEEENMMDGTAEDCMQQATEDEEIRQQAEEIGRKVEF